MKYIICMDYLKQLFMFVDVKYFQVYDSYFR